jgi:hypothetical protein
LEKASTVWEEVLIDQKEESTSTNIPLGTAIHNIEISLPFFLPMRLTQFLKTKLLIFSATLAFDSIWFARKRAVHCGESTQAMTLVNSTHRTFLEHKAAWTGSVSM